MSLFKEILKFFGINEMPALQNGSTLNTNQKKGGRGDTKKITSFTPIPRPIPMGFDLEKDKLNVTKKSPNIKTENKNSLTNLEKYIDEINSMTSLEIEELINSIAKEENEPSLFEIESRDPMFQEAGRLVVIHFQASASLIQRKLKLGYNRATRIIDQLEIAGIVGPFEGSKQRSVLVTSLEELEKFYKSGLRSASNNIKNQLFSEKYKTEIEKKRIEISFEVEKENIRNELLEKQRLKQLKRNILKELKEEGTISSQHDGDIKKREAISQDVKDKVWNRDSGKCVNCGSKEFLEFDHIIPFSKGGANTYRNLQILCRKCNLEKSNKIG